METKKMTCCRVVARQCQLRTRWLLLALAFGLALTGCDFKTDEEKEAEEMARETALVEGQWTDGNFSKEGQIKKFTFTVTKGRRYFIWLNDSDEGDRTKTANVGLKISHEDSTVICNNYDNASVLYTKPLTFSASSTGTVTITAAAYGGGWGSYWETGTGTYAIKYTSRAEIDALSEGEWQDDTIIATGQTNKYSIVANDKTRYFIYLNDTDAGSGVTTKTADVGVKISHSDGTIICDDYGNATSLYSKPYTFLAPSTGTITITAASYGGGWGSYWETGIGTYAIKYTARAEYDDLQAGVWKDDSIITSGQTNKYSIHVTAGTAYSIYLNDSDGGDGTKTADVGLKIFYSQDSYADNPIICDNYDGASNLYSKPYTFTASSTGTITITAAAYGGGWGSYWETGIGTYAIRYVIASSASDD